MPTLHLQVCAGFANRVRAMISGICFAEEYGLKLVIHWFPMSPECACRFQTVVDPESLPKTVKILPEDLYMAKEVLSHEDTSKIYADWDKTSDLFWKSYGIFYRNRSWETHLRALRPSRMVKEVLDRRCQSVDWSTAIGVHIRRGDNKKAIEGSPLENFLQKMRSNSDVLYIIATDDQTVKGQLLLEFGDRCLFPAAVLSRKTEEGMVHGVADFFALTKCRQLWGSSWSSFSEVAAWYGAIDLTIV